MFGEKSTVASGRDFALTDRKAWGEMIFICREHKMSACNLKIFVLCQDDKEKCCHDEMEAKRTEDFKSLNIILLQLMKV